MTINLAAPRALLLLSLLSLCCVLAGPARAQASLTVMVEDAAGPWSNHDGSGMANDLVRAAYAAVGIKVALDVVPYARCKAMVINGRAAACFSMSGAPELKQVVRFAAQPLFNVYPRFYRRAGSAFRGTGENAIPSGSRVGIVNGYEYPDAVNALRTRGVVLEAARSDVVNLKKLASGRLDLALIMTDDLKTDAMLIRQAGVEGVAFVFQSTPMGSFIGFSAAHSQGAEAQRQFNRGFERITRNGSRRAIEEKWRRLCANGCD